MTEKLRYRDNAAPRQPIFHESWSLEDGDCGITVSDQAGRVLVEIKREFQGRLEIELAPVEAKAMAQRLLDFLEKLERGSS